MKRSALLLLVGFVTLSSYAQKVDLDREYIKVKYTNLPSEPIADESFRTYAVTSNNRGVADKIKVYGFEKLAKEGTINVNIDIDRLIIDEVKIDKREKVNKDKDGKVTSTDRYYTPVVIYSTRGRYDIKNSQGKPLGYTLGSQKTYKGSEYNSYAKASNYYKNNSSSLKSKFQREFVSNSIYQINKKLNKLYGYEPYVYNELFWILDSKKNSDYDGHKKALADIKTMLGKVSHEVPLDEMQKELDPIVSYFESVVPKYTELKKKKHRKMRYASYYNIGRLYYHFDMPDKALEYANKVIENDYDKKDGKRLIKDVEALKKAFEINKVTTRHFPVVTVDNSGSSAAEEEVMEDEEPEAVAEDKYIETVFTNADGSTVEGKLKIKVMPDTDISALDFTKYYKNSVKVYTLTDDGEAKSKNYFAREKASFVANGATYEAVKFNANSDKESQGNVVSLDGAKFLFAKVLFKGKKLSLYKYKKEFVLKKTGDKKGQSTSSLAYSIGFKKKLAKLAADCPDVAALAKEGSFSNTEESLLAFVQEYADSCK